MKCARRPFTDLFWNIPVFDHFWTYSPTAPLNLAACSQDHPALNRRVSTRSLNAGDAKRRLG